MITMGIFQPSCMKNESRNEGERLKSMSEKNASEGGSGVSGVSFLKKKSMPSTIWLPWESFCRRVWKMKAETKENKLKSMSEKKMHQKVAVVWAS